MRRTLILLAAAAGLACAHADVSMQFDPKADFAKYKTYGWMMKDAEARNAFQNAGVYDVVIRPALVRELAARGLAPAPEGAAPDLLVAAYGSSSEKVEVRQYYGYAYAPGPYGFYPAPVPAGLDVQQYREGTLVVDLVDRASKQLVWRGTAVDTVTSAAQVQDKVDAAVRDLFANYPPRP